MRDELVAFTVYGRAQPGGSKRVLPAGGRAGGRPVVVDDNPKAKDWQRQVAMTAGLSMERRLLLTGPLRLTVRFVLVRPGGHFTSKGELSAEGRRNPYPAKRPDLTKLVRAVEDALTNVVWRNDDQVVQQEASKVYGEPARVEVEVESARPVRPYEDDPQQRLDRLDAATGPDTSVDVDRDEQLGTVLRMIERQLVCRCGAVYEPLARSCPACGRATFSQYAPAKRAARVPSEPENPANSEEAA